MEVAGWDRPEVGVRAEIDAGVERVDVDSEHGAPASGGAAEPLDGQPEAHLHVQVPRGSELHVTTVSADQSSRAHRRAAPEQRERRCQPPSWPTPTWS